MKISSFDSRTPDWRSSVHLISSPLPWSTMVILELHSSKNLFDRFLNLTHQRDAPSSPSYAQDHGVYHLTLTSNSNKWLVCLYVCLSVCLSIRVYHKNTFFKNKQIRTPQASAWGLVWRDPKRFFSSTKFRGSSGHFRKLCRNQKSFWIPSN